MIQRASCPRTHLPTGNRKVLDEIRLCIDASLIACFFVEPEYVNLLLVHASGVLRQGGRAARRNGRQRATDRATQDSPRGVIRRCEVLLQDGGLGSRDARS
jgi:hypothetical protein